jgi:hypothetical protein
MPEREGGAQRFRESVQRGEATRVEATELLLERSVGGGVSVQVEQQPSALRPQQSRTGIWRWHTRRRRREGSF